jgi:dienelactone hydrolase
MKLRCLWLVGWIAWGASAHAAMVVKTVSWNIGDQAFSGRLVYDDGSDARRPGLLMVPNWYGVNDAAVDKAKGIAGDRYVILLADMYGKDIRPDGDKAAQAAVKPLYADRTLMRKRVTAALEAFRKHAGDAPLDLDRLAAIGFCFGGSAVLDLARSGADVAAVVSFHGGLSTDDPALAKNIKARVLVMNGADDRGTMPDAPAFQDEMRGVTAAWQFVVFGGAVHCFTEVGENSQGCRYDADVAKRAYELMRDWLDEAFR